MKCAAAAVSSKKSWTAVNRKDRPDGSPKILWEITRTTVRIHMFLDRPVTRTVTGRFMSAADRNVRVARILVEGIYRILKVVAAEASCGEAA